MIKQTMDSINDVYNKFSLYVYYLVCKMEIFTNIFPIALNTPL